MSMNRDDRIQRALEGLLSPEEWERFQADILEDETLREAWVDRVWLHSELRVQGDRLPQLFRLTPAPDSKRWPVSPWMSAAAAACVTLLAILPLLWSRSRSNPPVATLVQANHCRWEGSDLPTALHSKLGTGTLALVEGVATLQFTNGALLTLEAPTKLEIRNAMHCRLLEGSVVAEVPPPAHGFTIDSPDMKVIDLGTRFGLTAGAGGNSQVHVFEGEVEVKSPSGGASKRLRQGKGLHGQSGNTPVGQEPARSEIRQEPDGWSSIPTSFGRGKDAFTRRGDNGAPTGAHPVLMVKHTDLDAGLKNERRAFLSFDLSALAPQTVEDAQLVLQPVPSGFGFSALVPDSRFAVYGLVDESLDSWSESSVRWNSAPGCEDSGPLPDQTRRLAEFWIPRGGAGPVSVRSAALTDFVRKDTNGLLTLLLVRETGESDPSGLVHGFASKEHPTARPPTLRLKAPPQAP
jgi:ferric-dicitrate binding protein FerR (iron transport regulator)